MEDLRPCPTCRQELILFENNEPIQICVGPWIRNQPGQRSKVQWVHMVPEDYEDYQAGRFDARNTPEGREYLHSIRWQTRWESIRTFWARATVRFKPTVKN